MERLNPMNDYLFGKMMGEKGDEPQLISFLNALLVRTEREPVTSVTINEATRLTADIIGDKTSILDIRAVTNGRVKCNIEVQLNNLGNMDRRSLFYSDREFVSGIESGKDYRELPDVIAINLLNFKYIDLVDFHTAFVLCEYEHRDYVLTRALEMHFVDMPRFRFINDINLENPLHRWMAFLNKESPETLLKEVIGMDQAIQQANEKLAFVSQDKEALRMYQMREMALCDITSGINHARREGKREGRIEGRIEGIAEGKKEGKIEEQIEIAKKALQAGIPKKVVRDITDLAYDILDDLK